MIRCHSSRAYCLWLSSPSAPYCLWLWHVPLPTVPAFFLPSYTVYYVRYIYYRWYNGEGEGDRAIDGERDEWCKNGLPQFHFLLLVVVTPPSLACCLWCWPPGPFVACCGGSLPCLFPVVEAPFPIFTACGCCPHHFLIACGCGPFHCTSCYTLCIKAAMNPFKLYIYIEIIV